MNEDIRAPRVRVVSEDGHQYGIMSVPEALRLASDQGLDLVEIVPNADPPVCKIIDYGKYRYEQSRREKLQRKHQQTTLVKEVRFHVNTDEHDFAFKVRHARKFLEDGHKVKASVVFKGREITYREQGEALLQRLGEALGDIGKIEQEARMEGRMMSLLFAPDRSKKKPSKKPPQDQSQPTPM
ncbi:MAG: translation initiation factor IF-3 [Bacteroidota bacterium]